MNYCNCSASVTKISDSFDMTSIMKKDRCILLFMILCFYGVLQLFKNSNFKARTGKVETWCPAPPWTGMENYDAYFVKKPDCSKFAKAKNLIYVYTAIGHFERRTKLRQKFNELSSKNSDFKMLFVIGAPSPENYNDSVLQELSKEFDNFGDLLQVGVVDTYANLAYKGLFTFNWTLSCISDLKLLAKIDDESSNILTDIFNKSKTQVTKKFASTDAIFCTVPFGGVPLRKNKKKGWIATTEQYPGDSYPPYCLGDRGMFLSPRVAGKLLQASKNKPVFHIDDVYVSGLLRERACLKLQRT